MRNGNESSPWRPPDYDRDTFNPWHDARDNWNWNQRSWAYDDWRKRQELPDDVADVPDELEGVSARKQVKKRNRK